MNKAQCVNNVNLQSLNGRILVSINWVFGVNRSALVRPAKTLTDLRVLRIRTDSLRNWNGEEQIVVVQIQWYTRVMDRSKKRKWDIGRWKWAGSLEITAAGGQDFVR